MTIPKRIEIPLGPFTRPADTPCQRESSEDDRIKTDVKYLVRFEHANAKGQLYWCCGRFRKQWYGWSFDGWGGGGGIQLNSIAGPLYEIVDQ